MATRNSIAFKEFSWKPSINTLQLIDQMSKKGMKDHIYTKVWSSQFSFKKLLETLREISGN